VTRNPVLPLPRALLPLTLLFCVLGLYGSPVRADFSAPRPIDEAETTNSHSPKKPKPPRPVEDAPDELPTTTDDPDPEPEQGTTGSAKPDKTPNGKKKPDAGAVDAGPVDAGPPPPPLVAPIEPVKATDADLLATWEQRRQATDKHLAGPQKAAEDKLLAEMAELGIADLASFSAAVQHEALKAHAAGDAAEALRLARLGVKLAPDEPEAHLTLARAALNGEGFSPSSCFAELGEAAQMTWASLGHRRVFLANLVAVAVLGLWVACVLGTLLLAARPLRYALHDFHHLFPRGTLQAQAAFGLALLLGLPWVLQLGGWVQLWVLAVAGFLYLSTSERVVQTVLLVLLGLSPLGAGVLARSLTFEGTRASRVRQLQQGGPDAALARSALEQRLNNRQAAFAEVFALALDAKRRGDYERAIGLYRQALKLSPDQLAATVNVGNAHLLRGEQEPALEAYQRAVLIDPASAAAQFNLAQASTRRSQQGGPHFSEDIERSKAALGAVYQLDRRLAERQSDHRANFIVADVLLTARELAPLAEDRTLGDAVAQQLRQPLFGALSDELATIATVLLGVLLWGLAGLGRYLRPCSECMRCGRPVCFRCDRDTLGGRACGQCLNVFTKKGLVDAQTRARKEAQVRDFQGRWEWARRALSLPIAGAGHLLGNRPVPGAAFLLGVALLGAAAFGAEGVVRPAYGMGWAPLLRWTALALGVGLWALSVWSYRRGAGRGT
jgi:tetratricopeptide (TPR) repeat protein